MVLHAASTSTVSVGADLAALAAALASAFIIRACALRARFDMAGRIDELRTPPANIAQLMQYGGFEGPKL